MRRYQETKPPEPLNFDRERAVEMIAALKKASPEQRLDTLAVVAKVLIEGHMDE